MLYNDFAFIIGISATCAYEFSNRSHRSQWDLLPMFLPKKETSCGFKKMLGSRRSQLLIDPPWKMQNSASSSAALTVLIFACLFKGLLSQESEYKLKVPSSVSVQRGLCVHIPCSFTSSMKDSEVPYGYWFKKNDRYLQYFVTRKTYFTVPGYLVTTNDKRAVMQKSVKGRFRLMGELKKGNCSFSILDAKPEDEGEYYFRFETNERMYGYNMENSRTRWPLKVLVKELTEKPQIRNNSAVLHGKEVVFTCLAPGPCFKMKMKILWTTVLLDYRTFPWSQQHSNGSWTYGSDLVFTPSTEDQGKWLTCRVWYPNIRKRVSNTIFLDVSDLSDSGKTMMANVPHWHLGPKEFFFTSVTLFLIVLYLFKLVFCFLLFLSIFWLFNWRELSLRGE
ncbi:sialic acid-binding Ig-like lectin 13 isoform X2 [Paroedura picta]|uniref:sialic acid-binding Ig-like lectin 13 isoform X2 n=1 Tax=Paroedura picta TaxID=143630 RepID=UPI00405790E9